MVDFVKTTEEGLSLVGHAVTSHDIIQCGHVRQDGMEQSDENLDLLNVLN